MWQGVLPTGRYFSSFSNQKFGVYRSEPVLTYLDGNHVNQTTPNLHSLFIKSLFSSKKAVRNLYTILAVQVMLLFCTSEGLFD